MSKEPKIPMIRVLKVRSLNDIARIIVTYRDLTRTPYIIHFESKGRHIYGILMNYLDYYDYNGVPIFYYCELDKELKGNYILIKVDETGEHVEVSNSLRPGWLIMPILHLAEKPEFIPL